MSTGDPTMYIRGKLAERGSQPAARFMRDGFDVWAESETPARAGQMEKEPAQTQMPNYGGAMSLSAAKQKSLGMDVRGGMIEVPQAIKDAVQQAKNLVDMWRKISAWIDSFITDLKEEIIENPDSAPDTVKFATQLLTMINNVKSYKDTLDGVAAALGAVGLGRGGRQVRGGKSAFSFEQIGKVAGNIAKIYMWFKNGKKNIEQILKLRSLRPYGQQVLDAIRPIFSAIGMGRGGFFGDFGRSFQNQFQDMGKMYQPAIEYGQIPVEGYSGKLEYGQIPAGEFAMEESYTPEYEQAMKEKKLYLAKMGRKGGAKYEDCPPGYDASGNICFKPIRTFKDASGNWRTEGGEARLRNKVGGAKYSSCPSGWTDDGLTCRKDGQVQAKVKIGGKACRLRGAFGECWDAPEPPKQQKACRMRGAFGECYDVPGMTGGSFYSGMMNNAMKAVAKPAMKSAYKYVRNGGAKYEDCPPGYNAKGDLCFNPVRTTKDSSGNIHTSGGEVVARRKVGGKKPSARGAIVRKVMDQMGVSMIQASKYVKEHGLY
jgi:hypothetical protein